MAPGLGLLHLLGLAPRGGLTLERGRAAHWLSSRRFEDSSEPLPKAPTPLLLVIQDGAPDELTPEDVEAFGLQGCAYMRGVSESLEWARS